MTNKKSGRPTKLTAEVVRKLEEALKFGATVTEACFISGISRDTFYQHYRFDQEFSDKMELSRNWMSLIARQNVANAIRTGNIKTSIWLLEKHNTLPQEMVHQEYAEAEEDNNRAKEMLDTIIRLKLDEYKRQLEIEFDLVPKNNNQLS